jgi:hypothetical protein
MTDAQIKEANDRLLYVGESTVTRDIFTRAVAVILDTSLGIGTKKKIPTSKVTAVEEGTDMAMLNLSKTILESKTLEKIRSLQSETRRHVTGIATPSVMFRSGVYMLALPLLREADEYLNEQFGRLRPLVAQFLEEYETDKASARAKLGPLYDPRDYPNAERVKDAIRLTWAYVSVETPTTVDAISTDIFTREQKKAAERWTAALDEATFVLRGGFAKLIDHMIERLEPGEDGKPKVFRDTLTKNIREWLRTFPARNLAGDGELDRLAGEAANLLEGITPEALRSADGLRDKVRDGMARIKEQLDAAITTTPTRRYGTS